MAICCVSEKIQTAHQRMTARPGFASLHLNILERPANFEFFNNLLTIFGIWRIGLEWTHFQGGHG
jgi:hypothetical protein